MPIKLRCKRHFVLQTVDGPLITVNPTPKSVLPASFKKAKTRSLAASHEASGVASPSTSKRRSTDGTTVVDPPPTTRHVGGGAVLEFAPIMPVPDSFGVPADDDELRKRERLGTVDRLPCALCAHLFDSAKLQFLVSRKAVVEQQTRWGRHELRGKDLTPANLYTSCRVCLFCYQFFEEKVQESSSVMATHDHAPNTSLPGTGGGYSPGSSSPHAANRATIVLVNKSTTSAHDRSASPAFPATSLFGGVSSAGRPQIHVGDVTYQPVPDNLSPPEYLEELRILQEQRRSQSLLQCLSRDWERTERAKEAYNRRMQMLAHRRREAERWGEEVERVRQNTLVLQMGQSQQKGGAEKCIHVVGGQHSSILSGSAYHAVPPSPSSASPHGGDIHDDVVMLPLVVTVSEVHDGGNFGGPSGGDAAGSSIDTASSIGRRGRRLTNGSTHISDEQAPSTTTAVPVFSQTSTNNALSSSFLAATRHSSASHSSPNSARGAASVSSHAVGGNTPQTTVGGALLDFTALELAEDNGEIELTDDLRAILCATPRSGRHGGLHSSTQEPNAYILARERLEASKRLERPGTAPLNRRSVVDFLKPAANKAQQLRTQAAAMARVQSEEDAYCRDCERRGMCPAFSKLHEFSLRMQDIVTAPSSSSSKRHNDNPAAISRGHVGEARVLPLPSRQTMTLLQALRSQKNKRSSTTDALVTAFSDRRNLPGGTGGLLVAGGADGGGAHASASATLQQQHSFRADSAAFQNGTKRFAMYSL